MRHETETRLSTMRSGETEIRLDCKIIFRPRLRLLINFQKKQDRDQPWFTISNKTETRPGVSYTDRDETETLAKQCQQHWQKHSQKLVSKEYLTSLQLKTGHDQK